MGEDAGELVGSGVLGVWDGCPVGMFVGNAVGKNVGFAVSF